MSSGRGSALGDSMSATLTSMGESGIVPMPGIFSEPEGVHPGATFGVTRSVLEVFKKDKKNPNRKSARLARCMTWVCQELANSRCFSALTTLLTLYALFGDDMRLLLTEKPADIIFDGLTFATMAVFLVEIIVCSVGKAGYFLGFFFFLDVISTVTLVLDVTFIAELAFGDAISRGSDAQDAAAGTGSADSAEAARAARMSRAGTKAGRVVRLIRLMRLIRLVKLFNKKNAANGINRQLSYEPGGGVVGDEEDDEFVQAIQADNELGVSKKLSEMTTRRVTILVLSILLVLPFFRSDMHQDALGSSAQYGIDGLYRRFREDMVKFNPSSGQLQRKAYLASLDRENYVNDFLLYTYFHNWFCKEVPDDKANSPMTSFGKLFWVGGSPTNAQEAEFFLPGSASNSSQDWNKDWNGEDWGLYMCNLPLPAQAALRTPWNQTGYCLDGSMRGVSIIQSADSRAKCPQDLRFQERIVVSPKVMSVAESRLFVFMFIFDRRSGSRMEAALNTGQTIFICLLLGVGAMTFSKDANKLVLAPIERMIQKLDTIRENPMSAMSIGGGTKEQFMWVGVDLGSFVPQMTSKLSTKPSESAKLSRWQRLVRVFGFEKVVVVTDEDEEPMETIVLLKTITKIGSLLALGFGEAGAEIIGENMKVKDSTSLNAMIAGKHVEAIFGCCEIRDLCECSEVLEEHVMLFVNRIAAIVHSCVDDFYGHPNQNLGDSFLLVWRMSGHSETKQQRLADCATVSFMKIVALIARSPLLAQYRRHPRLVKKLPGYRVCLGFGLHVGWSIEAGIGSEFRIEAAYLGTNVTLASTLKNMTHVYGNTIIISEPIIHLMSEEIASMCRLIDRVALPDFEPLKLYTMDLDDFVIEPDDEAGFFKANSTKAGRKKMHKDGLVGKTMKKVRWQDNYCIATFVLEDTDIMLMRRKYSGDFFYKFKRAFFCYEAGNWDDALPMLEETRFFNVVEDGPSAALLRFMKASSNKAPEDWPGYREYIDV